MRTKIAVVAIGKPRQPGKTRLDLPGDSVAMARSHAIDMDIIQGKGFTEFGIGRSTAFL